MSNKENIKKPEFFDQIVEEDKKVDPSNPCDPSHPNYPWEPCGVNYDEEKK